MTRVTMMGPSTEDKMLNAFELVKETVDDFTDSPYTSHDNREKIIQLTERMRDELHLLMTIGRTLVNTNFLYYFFKILYFVCFNNNIFFKENI